jgi:mercuric ion binding protein
MQRRHTGLLAVASVAWMLAAAWAGADVQRVQMLVDGLACPFCAYGLEKNLRAVKGVQSVEIRMNEGLITLRPKRDAAINLTRAHDAVRDSGFTLRSTRVLLVGRVENLETVAARDGANDALATLRDAARAQGVRLPDNPYAVAFEQLTPLFVLLPHVDKRHRSAFERLAEARSSGGAVVIEGVLPPRKAKGKPVPAVLYVERVSAEEAG